ncbi:AbrB/MazE/SpoVT family DNA-binding domain-containing protein [Pyrococcus kukulkanii]|uniref:AbrB family transcriptional regulator n=1 Tax=Pyrococcus kukulkanii TaxID=1609559 RepID=A0ABV4T9Q7_9EURY
MEPEPLAKFHATLNVKGQIVIPQKDREIFGLSKGDLVEIIVRKFKVEKGKIKILGRGYATVKLSSKGLVTIPDEIRKGLGISSGETVEVLIVGFHKLDELLTDRGKRLLNSVKSSSVGKILSPAEEQNILHNTAKKYYF